MKKGQNFMRRHMNKFKSRAAGYIFFDLSVYIILFLLIFMIKSDMLKLSIIII